MRKEEGRAVFVRPATSDALRREVEELGGEAIAKLFISEELEVLPRHTPIHRTNQRPRRSQRDPHQRARETQPLRRHPSRVSFEHRTTLKQCSSPCAAHAHQGRRVHAQLLATALRLRVHLRRDSRPHDVRVVQEFVRGER
jgi:hypothetical protein